MVAAALAISLVVRSAPSSVARPQMVLSAQAQGVLSFLKAHRVEAVPAIDPAVQSVAAYLRVHAAVQPSGAQTVPEAAVQGVAGYLRAHNVGQPSRGQTVPSAEARGIADYLAAHNPVSAGTALPALDPAQQSVMDYLRAHGW